MPSLATLGNDLHSGRRQIDFIGRRKLWYLCSAVLIALAALGLLGRGLNFSLEFTGGSEIRVPGVSQMANYDTRATKVVHDVTNSDADLIVTKLGPHTVDVKSKKLTQGAEVTDQLKNALAKEFNVQPSNITTTFIGPSWGQTVTHKAFIALITFLVIVSIVLALYFRTWKMAAAALIALIHDLIFTVGVYALTGLEVSPATMIGFLTILGYSIYDTVVVFDKVRENSEEAFGHGRRNFDQAANYAVNQMLVRSINTSVVALLPISAILVVGALFIGPSTLLDLAVALFIGIAIGTFSSIFIATPSLTDLRRREPRVQELARRAAAYQTRALADHPADAEHERAARVSGVVDAAKPGSAAILTERRTNRRAIHPAARQDAE